VLIGTIEGEEIMDRFRTMLADPVMRRMDYRTSCIKAKEIVLAEDEQTVKVRTSDQF
jgi:hypothetical protein